MATALDLPRYRERAVLPHEHRCVAVDDHGAVCGLPSPSRGAAFYCARHRANRDLEQRLSDAITGISPDMRRVIDDATYRAAVEAERAYRREAERSDA